MVCKSNDRSWNSGLPELLKDQRKAELKERSIVVFTADRIVEVETKKNESITTLTDDQSS